jgi:uncharacterized protein (TIGR02677 family)
LTSILRHTHGHGAYQRCHTCALTYCVKYCTAIRMPNESDRLDAFSYVTADGFRLYRAIMTLFMEERDRFALHLRAKEVLELMRSRSPELAREAGLDVSDEKAIPVLEGKLLSLCGWGNLERHQDMSEVRTVQEFRSRHFLYQLTRAGEEAERAIARYLDAVVEGGELQAAALADIRRLLAELQSLVGADSLDEGKAFETFRQLRSRFEELTARAQTFMSSLQRTIDLREQDQETGLLRYKEVLISYLERFIHELRISAREICGKIQEIEKHGLPSLLLAVARRELVDSLDRGEDSIAKAVSEWERRWLGLRSWFLGGFGGDPRSEVLRRKALSAIPQLLGAISRVNDRRVSRTDRVADLMALARWFAESDTEGDAHRLWMAAFGLTPSRHLTIDAGSLAEREAHPIPPRRSWKDAPPILITPRLRQTGTYVKKGPGRTVVDRSQGKAYLAAMAQEEAAQLDVARDELVAKGETRLSSLGRLSGPGFELFLDLLGDALSACSGENDEIETRSTDGTLLVRLKPTADGRVAEIETPSGTFLGPDHFVSISDALEANGGTDIKAPLLEAARP